MSAADIIIKWSSGWLSGVYTFCPKVPVGLLFLKIMTFNDFSLKIEWLFTEENKQIYTYVYLFVVFLNAK